MKQKQKKTYIKKIKLIFNMLYYSIFSFLLITILLLLFKPGIIFYNFNQNIVLDNHNYNIKIKKLKGNIFKGLYLEKLNVGNKYFCSQVFIKPSIMTMFGNNKVFDKIDMNCNNYNLNKNINKNFKEKIKSYINQNNSKIKIKKLDIAIKTLNFKFTKMNNLLIKGKNIDLQKKLYNLDIKFTYYNKNYNIILRNKKDK